MKACWLSRWIGVLGVATAVIPFQAPAATRALEGEIKPFMGKPEFRIEKGVFRGQRMPNVVVTMEGTLLAVWGSSTVQVRRSEDGGTTWGEPIAVGKGISGGGTIVNETNGDIFVFVEARHPPAPLTVYRSADDGKTWDVVDVEIKPDERGNVLSMHMNEHGITLRHGKHAGRLIRAARDYAGRNDKRLHPRHYTSAIYSDDHGTTWHASRPFPEFGTGEATIAELADGTIYYNTRRHWAPKGKNPKRRWHAWSDDGGETWRDVSIVEVLPDGDQARSYGLMGGLTRLPVKGVDILVFSNIVSPDGRKNGHVWASFDGGKTWPVMRRVTEGGFAYSSLCSGRPGTATEGWIYLGYEDRGLSIARFNLGWLLEVGEGKAELTGDGEIPGWVK